MKNLKEYRQLLEILDNILGYLINDTTNYSANIKTILSDVFNLRYDNPKKVDVKLSTDFNKIVESILADFSVENGIKNKLELAFNHLKNNCLVDDCGNGVIQITFKGLFSYSEGIAHKWDSELSLSQRLQTLSEENSSYQKQTADATVQMSATNDSIRRLTFWIMLAALVAIFYQVFDVLRTFFPFLFCKYQ